MWVLESTTVYNSNGSNVSALKNSLHCFGLVEQVSKHELAKAAVVKAGHHTSSDFLLASFSFGWSLSETELPCFGCLWRPAAQPLTKRHVTYSWYSC